MFLALLGISNEPSSDRIVIFVGRISYIIVQVLII